MSNEKLGKLPESARKAILDASPAARDSWEADRKTRALSPLATAINDLIETGLKKKSYSLDDLGILAIKTDREDGGDDGTPVYLENLRRAFKPVTPANPVRFACVSQVCRIDPTPLIPRKLP